MITINTFSTQKTPSQTFTRYEGATNLPNNFVDNLSYISPSPNANVSKKVKTGVAFTTVSGIALALAILAKGKGFSLNPSKILKTKPKDLALWKMKYNEKEILAMGAGSIGGGLIGGAIFDKKENMKAKYREAIIQAANISLPIIFVGQGIKFIEKHSDKIQKYVPQIKSENKALKFLNKGLKATPVVAVTVVSLGAGIQLANKLGNYVNEKIFKIKEDRKVKAADLSPHIDDVCLAISLMAKEDIFGHSISRIIPAALTIAGVSTGTAQQKVTEQNNLSKN